MYQKNPTISPHKQPKSSRKTDKVSESVSTRTDVAEILLSMANNLKKLLEIIEERENTRKGY